MITVLNSDVKRRETKENKVHFWVLFHVWSSHESFNFLVAPSFIMVTIIYILKLSLVDEIMKAYFCL